MRGLPPGTVRDGSRPVRPSRSRHPKFSTVRLIVIPSGNGYCRTVWVSILFGITDVLIGAVVMTTLLYALMLGDPHAVLCTLALIHHSPFTVVMPTSIVSGADPYGFWIGKLHNTVTYQFFTAEAILNMSYHGWSTAMRPRHKKLTHIVLQICAVICAITGTVLVWIHEGWKETAHAITGIITAALIGCSAISGPFALLRRLKIIHAPLGLLTLIMSSISLCLAFFKDSFKDWTHEAAPYILTSFVIIYTILITIIVVLNC